MRVSFVGLQKFKDYNMISFKQFLIENEILEDEQQSSENGITVYCGEDKRTKKYRIFAVEYKDGDLVNVFDNLGFNKVLPFDLRTGKIADDALENASEMANQIKDQYKVHKKKSMSEKIEMYLQKIFSAYKEVGKGITVKALCKFTQDILNTASKGLQSLFSSKGYKYYDRVTESEELDFDDVVKQLKKLIKKYTK